MSAAQLTIREAAEADLPALIALFADDPLGGHGDTTDPDAFRDYRAAFDKIAANPNETLYVAVREGAIVGTFQTLITTSLTGRGSSRMIIEAVQTQVDQRGQGIGAAMIGFCLERARELGMAKVQLTSNARRIHAHRFYERLGFERSHVGFRFELTPVRRDA